MKTSVGSIRMIFPLLALAGCVLPERMAGGTTDTGNSLNALMGTVQDGQGRPAQGAFLRLRRSDYLSPLPSAGKRGTAVGILGRVDTAVGEDGRFLIRDLMAGAYRIEFGDGQSASAALDLDIPDLAGDAEDRLVLKAVRLSRTAVVTGTALPQSPSSRPILRVSGLERLVEADPATRRFTLRLPAGASRLRFSDPECGRACDRTVEVSPAPGESVDLGEVNMQDTSLPYAAWKHAARITVSTSASGAGISEGVAGFPLLVRLDRSNFDFGRAKRDGADIRFSGAGGRRPLAYEIERWDDLAGRAEIWVRMDTVKGDDSLQSLEMHFGNAEAQDASDGAAVFGGEGGHAGVWHLAEHAGAFRDATGHGNHGTGQGFGGEPAADGAVGGARSFDGADDGIKVADRDVLDVGAGDFAISLWARADALGGNRQLFAKRVDAGADVELQVAPNAKLEAYAGVTPSVQVVRGRGAVAAGEWRHLALVRRGDMLHIYLDGEEDAAGGDLVRNLDNAGDLWIGRDGTAREGEAWAGGLDEVRLMRSAPSPAWMRLSHRTQAPGSSAVRVVTWR